MRRVATGPVTSPVTASVSAMLVAATFLGSGMMATAAPVPDAPECALFGDHTHWHQPVTDLPVHAMSATWVNSIGVDSPVHPDFGAGTWEGAPIGIPYTVVDGDQPRVAMSFLYDDESDPGPYPIPPDAPIEGGPDGDGDRHVLVVDRDACVLYEVFDAHRQPDGSWEAGSGAVFDLADDRLRPDGWTSADAAGLPILPGLVRGDEVLAGVIDHAIRFTAPRTARSYVWPARHQAGRDGDGLPPMGIRVRLKASVDLAGMSSQAQVVAQALKTYGAILADNGSPWFLSGAPHPGFDDDGLRDLRGLRGSDFEVVDTSSWIEDPDSRRVAGSVAEELATGRIAGDDRIATAIEVSRFSFPSSQAVVVARADDFADALGAATLAAALDAPILLTDPDSLDPRVRAEVERLGATRVDLVGGPNALGPSIEAAFGDRETHRWSGPDRYATTKAVNDAAVGLWRQAGFEDAGSVAFVALGDHVVADRAWPDALAAGVDAASRRARLVLVRRDGIPEASAESLAEVEQAFVAGGPGAVPDEVVAALGVPATRVNGADRVATSLELARHALQGRTPTRVFVASARSFPDALAAGPAVAAAGGVLVLTEPFDASAELRSQLDAWGAPTWIVGGRGAVSEQVRRQLG